MCRPVPRCFSVMSRNMRKLAMHLGHAGRFDLKISPDNYLYIYSVPHYYSPLSIFMIDSTFDSSPPPWLPCLFNRNQSDNEGQIVWPSALSTPTHPPQEVAYEGEGEGEEAAAMAQLSQYTPAMLEVLDKIPTCVVRLRICRPLDAWLIMMVKQSKVITAVTESRCKVDMKCLCRDDIFLGTLVRAILRKCSSTDQDRKQFRLSKTSACSPALNQT